MIYVNVINGSKELQLFLNNKMFVRDDIITITQNGKEYTVIYKS